MSNLLRSSVDDRQGQHLVSNLLRSSVDDRQGQHLVSNLLRSSVDDRQGQHLVSNLLLFSDLCLYSDANSPAWAGPISPLNLDPQFLPFSVCMWQLNLFLHTCSDDPSAVAGRSGDDLACNGDNGCCPFLLLNIPSQLLPFTCQLFFESHSPLSSPKLPLLPWPLTTLRHFNEAADIA